LDYCKANNIVVLGYPPHCTHALQGLDVVCFATMKEAWKAEINAFEELHQRGVDKEDFCGVWGRAFLTAFTPDLVKAAFEATGIHPFNRNIISARQMKPSEPTSTHAAFPLPQSSPVRAVLAAFHNHEFTHQDLHPDSPARAGPSTFPGSLSSPLSTPTREIPINPALYSPKRRLDPAWDQTGSHCASTCGSLVSDWLARRQVDSSSQRLKLRTWSSTDWERRSLSAFQTNCGHPIGGF
jgi:hypothetical protein